MNGPQVRSGLGIGLGTGLLAWGCCISAIVLGFLGLSAAAGYFAMIQKNYHWWLVGIAFVAMDIAIYYFLKHYHGSCNIKVIRHNYAQIAFIILVAIAAYYLLSATLMPLVMLAKVPMDGM